MTGEGTKVNPLSLTISLKPGFEVSEIKSLFHDVEVTQQAEDHYQISLKEQVVPADRDFVLIWKPVEGSEPTAGIFSESTAEGYYVMAMVMPPTMQPQSSRIPREVIFVIDTSGSMEGPSMEQAKAALQLAIDRLGREDRFNVIRFESHTFALFKEPRPADDETRELAKQAVDMLVASGGTMMAPAIELALRGRAPAGYLRQIVFITDGAVSNEQELFELVDKRLGWSRLFTVGIGSAPNNYFMVEAVEVGRGTYTYIGKTSEVGERMGELFTKLETPILNDLRAAWPAEVEVDASLEVLPDLYAGEPFLLTARISNLQGQLTIRGCRGNQPWQATLPLDRPSQVSGVGKLWARDRIDDLTSIMIAHPNPEEIRDQIMVLALAHGLVSQFTSLVVIDTTPVRPGEETLASRNVPLNLPRGWDPSGVFGDLADAEASIPLSGSANTRIAPPTPPLPPTGSSSIVAQTQPRSGIVCGGAGRMGDLKPDPGIWTHISEIPVSPSNVNAPDDSALPCGGLSDG